MAGTQLKLWFDADCVVHGLYLVERHTPVVIHELTPVVSDTDRRNTETSVQADSSEGMIVGPHQAIVLSFVEPIQAVETVRMHVMRLTGNQVSSTLATAPAALLTVETVPLKFALHAAVPNPFTGQTHISFDLPQRSVVRLEIFDIQGRTVATLARGEFPAGYHSVSWDGRQTDGGRANAGVFFYRLTAGTFEARRTLIRVP